MQTTYVQNIDMVNDNETEIFSVDKRDIGDAPDYEDIDYDDVESEEIFKELTSKVNALSMKEREAGLFDLHGISCNDEKTPIEEREVVAQMRAVITKRMDYWAAESFRMADSQNPEFLRDEKFLLMFLRCENYDIYAAIKRLFAFFKQKLRLFGPEKVGKKMISLDDLSADDMECYSAGFFQLLPNRDHVGRAQLVSLPQFVTWKQRENGLRMMFHLFTTLAMDEETQKNGVVAVIHALHDDGSNKKSNDTVFAWESTQLMQKVVPMRIVGQHICTNPSPLASLFYASMCRFLNMTGIARVRFHKGSSGDVEKQLSTFGITNVDNVITHTGEKKTDKHREFLKTVKCIENALRLTPMKTIVLVPSSTDILLGRGKPIQNHAGNVRLGLIVESQLLANPNMSSRREKTKLAEITLVRMRQAGMRFITKENGYWEEVTSDKVMRERVSNAFRTVRDRLKFDERQVGAAVEIGARKRSLQNSTPLQSL